MGVAPPTHACWHHETGRLAVFHYHWAAIPIGHPAQQCGTAHKRAAPQTGRMTSQEAFQQKPHLAQLLLHVDLIIGEDVDA